VARQQGQRDGETALGEVLRPGAQRLRGAGETVAEKDADLSAFVAERLGSRKDRHLGLLFMSWGGKRLRVCFTVRDRTDTDQGRRVL
jgi:hypothetical protein